jgi:hypothetical protein
VIVAGKVCALRLRGHLPAAEHWIPVARSLLEKLVASGEAVGQKAWSKPRPDVYIEVGQVTDTTAYLLIKATSSPGYMESGYLDYRTWQAGLPEFYLPAVIGFNTPVGALPQKTHPNASPLRPVRAGDLSRALGVGYKQRTLTLPGGAPLTGKYCDPGKITVDKTMHQWVAPCLYTGLLRLYVQALYGSLARDFGPALDTWGYKLAIAPNGQARRTDAGQFARPDDIPLWWHADAEGLSSGLYRAPRGEGDTGAPHYWLIQVQWDGLFAIEMRPVAPIVTLDDYWTDPRLEAHYLAGLRPRGERVRIGDTAHDILGPSRPIAYGFHFNSDGSRAVMIGVEPVDIAGTRRQAGPPIPARSVGMRARRFELTLTGGGAGEGRQPAPPVVAVTVAEAGTWMPWVDQVVWVPEYWRGIMLMGALQPYNDPMNPDYTGWDVQHAGSADIYAWFDAADVLQTVNVTNVVIDITDAEVLVGEDDYLAVFNFSTETLGDGTEHLIRDETQSQIVTPPQTVTIAGAELGRESVVWSGQKFQWFGGMAGGGGWNTGFTRFTRPWFAGEGGHRTEDVILTGEQGYSGVFGRQIKESESTHVTNVAVMIPWDDASAVYSIEREYQYGEFRSENLGEAQYSSSQWGQYKVKYKETSDAPEQEAFLHFYSVSELNFTNSGGGPVPNTRFFPERAQIAYSDSMFLRYRVRITTAHGHYSVYTEENPYTPGDATDFREFQNRINSEGLFAPRADNPFYRSRVSAKEPHFSPDVWADSILLTRPTGAVHWPTEWPRSTTISPVGFV